MSPQSISLRFTTTPGIEDIAAAELRERLSGPANDISAAGEYAEDFHIEAKPLGLEGHIMLHSTRSESRLRGVALEMRSCYHVVRHIASMEMTESEPLAALATQLHSLDIAEMRSASAFRVTTNRSGEHSFRSMDVQRVAGAALVERYGTEVDLEGFDTEIRVDAFGNAWLVGVQWTRDSLDKRYPWTYRPRVTLRTNIAYAMIRLAELLAEAPTILDPFCGSGTIPIEAASIRADVRCLAADRDAEAVTGTGANAAAVGLSDRIDIREADARDLTETYAPASIDAIITNPPYGIRLGKHADYADLYRKFLAGAATVLKPGGRVVVLVGKRRAAFNRVLREQSALRIVTVRVIEIGGVYPAVFVLTRYSSHGSGVRRSALGRPNTWDQT